MKFRNLVKYSSIPALMGVSSGAFAQAATFDVTDVSTTFANGMISLGQIGILALIAVAVIALYQKLKVVT